MYVQSSGSYSPAPRGRSADAMKALTVAQPWAWFIASGLKTMETRSWRTRYRGPIAIHSAAGASPESRRLLAQLDYPYPPDLAYGAVLCTATLAAVVETDMVNASEIERRLGDYSPGRWAWVLVDVQAIDPVPARGSRGLWAWPS